MDIMTLGADAAVIGAIIGITKVITSVEEWINMKKITDYPRYYPLIPAVLGAIAAVFMTRPLGWQEYGRNFLIYVGTSTYIYKLGKTTLLNK